MPLRIFALSFIFYNSLLQIFFLQYCFKDSLATNLAGIRNENHAVASLDTPQLVSTANSAGKRLFGHTTKTVNAESLMDCFKECLLLKPWYCSSLNLSIRSTSNKGQYICELNDKTVLDDPDNFEDDADFVYYDVF